MPAQPAHRFAAIGRPELLRYPPITAVRRLFRSFFRRGVAVDSLFPAHDLVPALGNLFQSLGAGRHERLRV